MQSDFKKWGSRGEKKEGNPTIASPQVENQICVSWIVLLKILNEESNGKLMLVF